LTQAVLAHGQSEVIVIDIEIVRPEREIVVSRLIEGPRALVFEVYTKVEHLSRWWGPDGFTTTTHAFEFKLGGEWDFIMHGPDGVDYPNWIRWDEIRPPERIVLTHGQWKDDPQAFISVITFTERASGTELSMRAIFPSKERRDEVVEKYGAIEGGKQTLGRLAEYVKAMSAGAKS
jgi:uncharacterized protein YndB with AHSA1/START domain